MQLPVRVILDFNTERTLGESRDKSGDGIYQPFRLCSFGVRYLVFPRFNRRTPRASGILKAVLLVDQPVEFSR